MAFNIITGTPGVFDPTGSYVDSGWVIADGYATHSPCNAGKMAYVPGFALIIGRQYTITYTLDNYISGGVKVILGTTNGTTRTANGTYTETLTCVGTATMQFFSDGALRISAFSVYDTAIGSLPGKIVAFYDGEKKKWGMEMSYSTEQMCRFKSAFYAFKDGSIWLQNSNEIRCNFFGVQYVSLVHIIANVNPTELKIYYSMRVKSNRVWYAANTGDIFIPATEGKTNGMQSRLHKPQFRRLQGNYFADFLRNMLTPGFDTPKLALFKGVELRGEYMEIILTNDDTVDVTLFEIDIKSAKSMYTY